MASTLMAVSAGYAVLRLMRGHPGVARVHSVFNRAINILHPSGRLITVTDNEIPESPSSIGLAEPMSFTADPRLRPGVIVRLAGQSLDIGGILEVDVSQASEYMPYVRRGKSIAIRDPESVIPLISEKARSHSRGFGPLYRWISEILDPAAPITWGELEVLPRLGAGALQTLVAGTLSHDLIMVESGARILVGLGEGLTPSGDDALAGYLVSLKIAARAIPSIADRVDPVVAAISSCIRTGTTDISREMLHYALMGEGIRPLEDMSVAMLSGDRAAAEDAWAALICIGNSSGLDQALGVLSGVKVSFKLCGRA